MEAELEVVNPGPRITGHSLAAWAAEARELTRLAVPMAATQLAQMIILATDTVMLGHFSKEALAAGAIGNTVFFFIWLLGTGPVSAVSPMIAHVVGRHGKRAATARKTRKAANQSAVRTRDQREVRLVVRMGLWSVVLMSPPLLGGAVLYPRHSSAAAAGAQAGGGCRHLYGGAGIRPALFARLPGPAQFFHFAQPAGSADGGDGACHPVQRAGRLCPDLRAFRLAETGIDGRGPGQRVFEPVYPDRDDGDRAAAAQSASPTNSCIVSPSRIGAHWSNCSIWGCRSV